MKVREYKIEINANAQKVWFVLWDNYNYKQWTNVFHEGSNAVTDNWKEGSKVHFLTPEGKGMYSIVSFNKPLEKMEFTHIGNISDFKELPLDEEAKEWSGGKERYSISENNGVTTLVVAIDVYEKYMDYFDGVFPTALKKVKTMAENFYITIQVNIKTKPNEVWEKWNNADDITKWCTATETWHTPSASNDLRLGGLYQYRMEAKDGSMGFDFEGTYTAIEVNHIIEYTIIDGRKVKIKFEEQDNGVLITESFEPESMNSFDLQRDGWQSILNNFKKYVEHE